MHTRGSHNKKELQNKHKKQKTEKKRKYWSIDGNCPEDNFYTPRTRVLKFLDAQIHDAKEKGGILLRAPFASGKTSLIKEAHTFFEEKYEVISVSMLCSTNCTNEDFDRWLFEHAFIGPSLDKLADLQTKFTGGLWKFCLQHKSPKPFLLLFDEIQKVYNAHYAASFWDTLKRVTQEPAVWNVQAIIAAGVYEDLSTQGQITPAEFKYKYGTDLLYFSLEEVQHLVVDFNSYNSGGLQVAAAIAQELHNATGGHPGFIIHSLMSIEDLYGKKENFTPDDWVMWKAKHFQTAIGNSRTAIQLKNLPRDNPGWYKVVQQLLEKEPQTLKFSAESPEDRLVKSGIICQAPGTADTFMFGSPAVRLLLLEALLEPAYRERPIKRWFDSLLDLLTVAVPMMNNKLITSCLSTMLSNNVGTWNEAVWQNHFFAALYNLIPNGYAVDPEYHPGGNRGRVDYRIHGEDFTGSVEWLITEFPTSKSTDTVHDYILKHYYRFVPDPNGKFPQTYKLLEKEPFMVVNVSHKKSSVNIPGLLPMTYADLIINDELKTVDLYIDDHHIKLEIGVPIKYNLETHKSEPFVLQHYTSRVLKPEPYQTHNSNCSSILLIHVGVDNNNQTGLVALQQSSQPSTQRKKINIKRMNKRGGVEMWLPNTMEDLLSEGGRLLGIKAVKVRNITTEFEIADLSLIEANQTVYLTNAEDEAEFD